MLKSLGNCTDLGVQINGIFKQVGPDRNDCAIVSEEIVDSLSQIKETLEYRSMSPSDADDLHDIVSQFETELKSVLASQRRLYRRGKNGAWHSFMSKTQENYHVDKVKNQLIAMHQRIQTCNQILQVCTDPIVPYLSTETISLQQTQEGFEAVGLSGNDSFASAYLARFTSASIRKERLREDQVDELSGTLSQVHIQGSNFRNPIAQSSSQSTNEVAQLCTAVSLNALDFTGQWTKLPNAPTSVGGNSDIFKAELAMDIHRNDGKQLVAIKVLRSVRIPANRETSEILKNRLMREMAVWSQLHHVNVVPFLGYGFTGELPCLIAPWYANGHIPDYMTRNPNIDRTPLVMGVIDGLVYLHSFDPPIVHGDLKASNVLVDDQGHARIADFGLSRMLQEGPSGFTTSSGITGTHRWMAPELFMTEGAKYTTASDIYAISLLILEIYTGKIPFSHLNDIPFLMAIIKPTSPDRSHYQPCNITERCWRVFERGWSIKPSKRPSVADFKRQFNIALEETSRETSNNLQVRDLSQSSESLRCMAPKQYDNRRYDVSIKAYEEDVKIGRELVERDGQTYLLDFISSLRSLGRNFGQARRHNEATASIRPTSSKQDIPKDQERRRQNERISKEKETERLSHEAVKAPRLNLRDLRPRERLRSEGSISLPQAHEYHEDTSSFRSEIMSPPSPSRSARSLYPDSPSRLYRRNKEKSRDRDDDTASIQSTSSLAFRRRNTKTFLPRPPQPGASVMTPPPLPAKPSVMTFNEADIPADSAAMPGPRQVHIHRRGHSTNDVLAPLPSLPLHHPVEPPLSASFPDHLAPPPSPLYSCTTIVPLLPPPDTPYYMSLPILRLYVGDTIEVLHEAGHPSQHSLPFQVDDGDDCVLLARDESGRIGWAFASFVIVTT
ncbi:hypothetical protein FRC02_012212 [Tulasnella sp. 418]|nr:hypothetical protein FRC02_012212 [Tulasnella sp. 418]